MKIILKYCGLAAVLAGAALYFSSCDEEVREPYGGPWKLVKTPPEVEAPIKDIFFLDANTGWATVGLAPMTIMTSASITLSNGCVPADVPSVCLRPYPVGE